MTGAASLDEMLTAAGLTPLTPPGPGEFTADQAQHAMGVARSTATKKLMDAVAAGRLACRDAKVAGKVARVYRLA